METNAKKRYILTVTELNGYIKSVLEQSDVLGDVYIKGEISNFTNHYKTGYFYFTIKDSASLIKAVMFKTHTAKLKFLPENGIKIIAHGRVAVFERDGVYQMYCDDIEPDGVGSLYLAYEQLKKRLESEGIFSKKTPLPKIPKRIGIITSPTGAAVQDMINIITRRFPFANIILFPVTVQGEKAPSELINALKYFNSAKTADVLIIGRGGGSIEDLWAFNDEALARTLYESKIPVISAVGHETDFTICDFAADLRAPTPSAAAEIAVPETEELKKLFLNVQRKAEILLNAKIKNYREKILAYENKKVLKSPENIIDDKRMQLIHSERNLTNAFKMKLEQKKSAFIINSSKLDMLNPLSILTRGYGVAYDREGKIIKNIKDVNIGDNIMVKIRNGKINSTVNNTVEE